MASGGRLRKVIVAGALVIVGLGLAAVIFRDSLSLEYHKRRLVSAKARHWRLTTQGYSFWDHVAEIARGRPVSTDEVVAAWKRHEETLVQRGFLKREVFVAKEGMLPSRSTDHSYNEALAHMEATCRWWSATRVETNLVVTGCAKGLADWKVLSAKIGLVPKGELSQNAEKPQKRCSRKRKKFQGDETLAASLASGYNVDDEFVRAFLRQRSRFGGILRP
ncbi:MAG TPA: hypothetical protein VJ063_06990 [Verrucomicrobiae bacterium]|nr:hypothetical protein [Verrucomicrobiae bacterium]